jgi:hypothetical protein
VQLRLVLTLRTFHILKPLQGKVRQQPVYHPETVCGWGGHVVCSGMRALGILKNVCSMAI